MKKFWDRITDAIRRGAHGNAFAINQIEIHFDGEAIPPHIIQGGDASYDFLAAYSSSLIGSRALAAYGDVDGSSAANNRPWSRKCIARLLRRSDARASVHSCAGTRSVRRGGGESVG